MARFTRPRHDAALVTSYLRQLREATPQEKRELLLKERGQRANAVAISTAATSGRPQRSAAT
jgi:hypothetical protein